MSEPREEPMLDPRLFGDRRDDAVQAVAQAFAGVIHNSPGPDQWAGENAVAALEAAFPWFRIVSRQDIENEGRGSRS